MNELKRILIHIRLPLQSFTLLGFLFGMVVSRPVLSANLLLGLFSWLLLCSGMAVFNSYYDKDTAPVAGLENPPAVSSSMLIGAWILKISGLTIAIFLNKFFLTAYIVGLILSVLYSHENFRLKSNGYLAVFFNFISGAVTFIVSISFSNISHLSFYLGSIGSGLFLASIYLMMQIHQKEEDERRNDISVMVMFGRRKTLLTSFILMIFASILSLATLIISELKWYYILIICLYFFVAFVAQYWWLKLRGGSRNEFKIMNRLTLTLSYVLNIILIIIYILK